MQPVELNQAPARERSCLSFVAYHFCDASSPNSAAVSPGPTMEDEQRAAPGAAGGLEAGGAQDGAHVALVKPEFLPRTIYGMSPHQLSPSLKARRNRVVYACILEVLTSLLCIPLGAVRAGIGRMNAAINGLLFFVALVGLNGALRFNKIHVLLHWLLVMGLVGAFTLFVTLSVLFGSSTASGNWIIVVVYIFLLVDLAIANESRRFQVALSGLQREQQAAGMDGGAEGERGQQLFTRRGSGGGRGMTSQQQAVPHQGIVAMLQPQAPQQQARQQQRAAALAALPSTILADAEHLPDEFLCPITREVMNEPVVCSDGHTYELQSIQQWLRTHRTSPKTNSVLPNKNLIPNHALRSQINDLCERVKAERRRPAAGCTTSGDASV